MGTSDSERNFVKWFTDRFWSEHLRMHQQALTIAQLAAGQVREPVGFVDGLVDPQPLLDELEQKAAPSMSWLKDNIQVYLLAWQEIRGAAVKGQTLSDGANHFERMLKAKKVLDDLVLRSLRGGSDYVQ